jgi:hypothetical protein
MPKDKVASTLSPEDHEKFEQFLFEMDDVLEQFLAYAAAGGFILDYSLASLNTLEQLLLIPKSPEESSRVQNRAARYLGEVFRKQLGGKWMLCDRGPRYVYQGLPVIGGHSDKHIEFCPIHTIGNFARTSKEGLFRRALEGHRPFIRNGSRR